MGLLGAIGLQGGYVLAAITLFVLPIVAAERFHSGPAWRGPGKGRLAFEHRVPPPRLAPLRPPVDEAVQATEIRQMLEAKADRRRRRGGPPLDVDAEMTRLLSAQEAASPDLDGQLRAEVRSLVLARNERRMRSGEAPLDVAAETERQMSDLIGLGR